jgi:hypothetical protein
MMIENPDAIRDAIENLSKKRHVISDEALRAREEQLIRQDQQQKETDKKWDKKLTIIEEFTDSVHLLMAIFKQSALQDIAMLTANPTRILLLSFSIGIFRGLGFAIGFLLVLFGIAVVFLHSAPHDVAAQVMRVVRDALAR